MGPKDGEAWTSAALLRSPRGDLRDPKIVAAPGGRVFLTAAIAFPQPGRVRHQTVGWYSRNGRDWGEPFDIGEVCERIEHRHRRGAGFSIVVVAEGAAPVEGTLARREEGVDEFGHVRLGGIGNLVVPEIETRTGYESRGTIPGHVLRGGRPTAYDRVLATRFGSEAIDAVQEGDFGTMVALRGAGVTRVPIDDAVRELKTVDPELYDVASIFFG